MRWDAASLAPLKNENNSLYLALPHGLGLAWIPTTRAISRRHLLCMQHRLSRGAWQETVDKHALPPSIEVPRDVAF
jgi:hypothetical protein